MTTTTENLSVLRSAIKSNPNDVLARNALADLYKEMGQERLAERQLEMVANIQAELKAKREETEKRREELRKFLPKGSTVFTIVRYVSRSGMRRRISFYAIKDNRPFFLDGLIGNLLDITRASKGEGLILDGCGMDMAYHVVHNLAYSLYQDGYALHKHSL